MGTLYILPCGKKKIWDINPACQTVQAKHAYVGTFHQAAKAYATTFAGQWCILSAKHGFLLPEDTIAENYDLGFHHTSAQIISQETLKQQWHNVNTEPFHHVVFLTGKKHIHVVQQLIHESSPSITFHYPLHGASGIGEMIQRLQQAVHSNNPL
ncbi:DUF6884 domain-containing protein [Salsuginibacillus kocurii]|uniref:DUF6884 domain-containing protein n=1 Tax=Salsuginibacillus kocurii TaxID=427078 RepID=UPI00036156DA|nr:DUF6884 domain-containing protein [Salsuginibacillus kocurii]